MSFNRFGLLPQIVRGTQAMGFVEPTPIQLRAFPIILAGKDLIGTAQTGTGQDGGVCSSDTDVAGKARWLPLSRARAHARIGRASGNGVS